ncbi:MAG: M14 family metallopeptidase [Thermoplasmata archaeon]|nr:M14 family metallopeptidase [Thermoplasmata archaeon]
MLKRFLLLSICSVILLVPGGCGISDGITGEKAVTANPLLWENYHSYNSTNSLTLELFNLSAQHPDIMKVVSIGKSWEGRDIWAVKISKDVDTENPDKPEILFDSNHHAREWLTIELGMFIIHKFVDEYPTNSTISALVNTTQIWVIPTMNPDGRVYDGNPSDGIDPTSNNMWRKNKRDNNGNGQFDENYDGVDINRNYPYAWGSGSSSNPGADDYRGPYPASEPEVQAYMNFVKQHHFIVGVSYHTYGQYILYPWGYTSANTPDEQYFNATAYKLKSLFRNTAGSTRSWIIGQPPDVLYSVGGSTLDYLYGVHRTLSFSPELYPSFYDPISDGFHPPANKIYPACYDQIEAVVYLVDSVKNPYYILNNTDDVGVMKIEPFTNTSTYEPGQYNLTAYVENYGSQNQTNIGVKLTLAKNVSGSEVTVYTDTRTITDTLAQNQTYKLTWNYTFTELGNFTISVETLKADNYSANNKKKMEVTIKSSDTTPPAIVHTPVNTAEPDASVYINATIIDDSTGVKNATVLYSYDNITFTPVQMTRNGSMYSAVVPAPSSGFMYYYLVACDNVGNTGKLPANAPANVFVITVVSTGEIHPSLLNGLICCLVVLMFQWFRGPCYRRLQRIKVQ